MRSISAASLAKLAQKTGTEPINIIDIDWVNAQTSQTVGPIKAYGDKAFPELGIEGRILSMDNINDILNVSKSGVSQSVNVTLDDSDGELKRIFNNTDIHKKRVWIYQWFSGIPIGDKFLVFSGVIASPIIWKEGDRTLTFTVMNRAAETEVGFSPEEGSFDALPENLIGTTWPIIFGTVAKLPLIRADDIPSKDESGSSAASITKDGTGIRDPSLKPQIDANNAEGLYASSLAQYYFLSYLQASSRARREGELGEFDMIQVGKGRFSALAKQYLDLGNKALLQAQTVRTKTSNLKAVESKQKSFELKEIPITGGENMPQNKTVKMTIGGAVHTGHFVGENFIVTERTHPENEMYEDVAPDTKDLQTTIPRQTFFWADGGTPATFSFLPGDQTEDQDTHYVSVRYIVSSAILVTVNTLYAFRTVGEVRNLYAVPAAYYQVVQTQFGTLPVTMIYLSQPLSTRTDAQGKSEGWEDEIWATVTSPVGPNVVSILQWLIFNYTPHNIDATSFNSVQLDLAAYPANFAILDRPKIMTLLQQIAYQSRCIIWLKDNVFYIQYKSKRQTPVAVIQEADIIEQSLEVSYTETEDLVTKYTALWRSDYKQSREYKIVLRYNIQYYGLNPEDYNYFIYNMLFLVEKSATFWLIRQANTFKYVTCRVPIKFLNIESLDTVTLNFAHDFIANGPIDCVVEEAVVDTAAYEITLKLWVPVRAGEMTEYLFTYLNDLGVQYYFPTDDDVSKGRAVDRGVKLPDDTAGKPNYNKPLSGNQGNTAQLRVTVRPHTWGSDINQTTDVNNPTPTFNQRIDTTNIKTLGKKPDGTTKYQYDRLRQQEQKTLSPEDPASGNVYPGFIVEGEGEGPYTVTLYKNGLDGEGEDVEDVYAMQIDEEASFAEGTACFVIGVDVQDAETGETVTEYIMQPPVWQ